MSVFKIEMNRAKTQEEQEVEQKQNSTEYTDTQVAEKSEQSEQQNMTAGVAEIPPEGAGDVPAAVPDAKKDIKIKIDGPVGQVFTDALNKMLAVESYMTLSPMSSPEKESDLLQDLKDEEILQVYCYQADELNVSDMVSISDEITRHTERNYVLSIETAGNFPSILEAAENLARLPNVSLFLSRKAAMNHIQSEVRK